METLTSAENRCLLVRARARKKSLPIFVKNMQKCFPYHFNDAPFVTHEVEGQEKVSIKRSVFTPQVIRLATHYLIKLHYIADAEQVFHRVRVKYRDDPVMSQQVDALIREVKIRTLKGVAPIIHLVYLEYGKETNGIPNLAKLYNDIRWLIVVPAMQACRILNKHVVHDFDKEIVTSPGCLIEYGTVPVVTTSTIWLISFSYTAASSDNRLRLLTLYLMMGRPAHIKQIGVLSPHGGFYSTIDLDAVPEDKLQDLQHCLYGTPSLTRKALSELRFEKRFIPQVENFLPWYKAVQGKTFFPAPYIGLLLSLAGGELEKGQSVERLISRLTLEREAVRRTGKASGENPSMFFIDTVMTMMVVNDLHKENIVFILSVAETLLRWFNRTSHYTRLTSLSVQSSAFKDPKDDTLYVNTNNQSSIVRLNYNSPTTKGVDVLIRQQVKKRIASCKLMPQCMSPHSPLITVVSPLAGEALCYESRGLPSVVYDLLVSDLLNKQTD